MSNNDSQQTHRKPTPFRGGSFTEKCREAGAGKDMQIFNYCKSIFIDALNESHSGGFNEGWKEAEKLSVDEMK